jgi:hypothetical protein
MGIASVVEQFIINFNCFFPSRRARTKRQLDIDNQLKDINARYGVHLIKVEDNFHIKNLYPSTDEVQKWSIFVIGNDFTYIHACIGEFQFPHAKDLLNRKGTNIIPTELNEVFEPIWIQTLNGEQVQMYMIVSSKLYLVNSYPFYNGNRAVIGAVMFIRPFVSERSSFEIAKENR